MAFDPDEYLGAATATAPAATAFDPDEYLGTKASAGFDPDEYLGKPKELPYPDLQMPLGGDVAPPPKPGFIENLTASVMQGDTKPLPATRGVEDSQDAEKGALQAVWDEVNTSPVAGVTPQPQGDTVAAGITRGIIGVAESLPTPMNAATAVTAGLGGPVTKAVMGAVFAAPMIKSVPEQFVEAAEAKGTGEKAERYTTAIASALLGGLATGASAKRPGKGGDGVERIGHEDIERAVQADITKVLKQDPAATAAETVLPPDITGETTLPKAVAPEIVELDRQDVLEYIDKNSPGVSLNYSALRSAIGSAPYVETRVKVADLKFEPGSELLVDPSKAIPSKGRIVVGPDGIVIDGRHRALMAKARGDEFIDAYAPKATTPEPAQATEPYRPVVEQTDVAARTEPAPIAPKTEATKPAKKQLTPEEKAEQISILQDVIETKKANGQKVPESLIQKLGELRNTVDEGGVESVFADESVPGHPLNSDNPVLPLKLEVSEKGLAGIEWRAKEAQKRFDAANKALTTKTKGFNRTEFEVERENMRAALTELGRLERSITERIAAKQSQGPGAASAHENLIRYEERKFGQRLQETESIAPEVREATGNRYYEPVPNKVTVAEAEAIIDARGIDEATRLVRDPEFKMEHRVRTVMAQGLIKKLNEKYQQTKGTPEAETYLNQAVDAAEYVGEFGTQLGQGVQAFAVWSKLTPEGMLVAAQRQVKKGRGKGLTPEETAKISDMTKEIEKAPEGFQKDEKTVDLMNYMSKLKGADPADVPTALYYANILSGYSTQLVNTLDTSLNVLSESAAMAASHPTAAPDIIAGLYRGMIRGGFEAASVLKTGRSPTGDKIAQQRILERTTFGEKGGVPIKTDTVLGRFMKAAFESKAAKPLNLWKYPLRMMVASDTLLYNSMKEARMRVLARVMAKEEGLKGDALFQRVDEILHGRTREAAEAQAKTEGLTGLRKTRRVNEIVEQGRPEELVASADDFAAVSTYNHTPTGAIGMIATKVGEMAQNYKPLVAIVPFTRIIANVTNRGLDYTPYGFKRLFFGQGGSGRFANEAPTGEAFRTQLVKATLGTTAMAAVAALDATDKIQVTAKGPDDPDERNQMKNAGWKPYSVKIGDKYVSYQYTPLNLGFAIIGHYRDAIRYNKLSEKDAGTRLAYGTLKSLSTVFDMSFLSGVNDFMESVSGAKTSTQAATKMFGRTLTSAVIPNLVKQLDRLFDPTVYSADTVTEAMIRETPIARTTKKPLLNVLGEPIQYDNNRFFSSEKKDPVWRLIVEKQAWVPVPSKTSRVGNRAITPEEYYELIEKSGPQIRSYIQSNLGRFEKMNTEAIQDDIRAYATGVRSGIKAGFASKRP